MTYKCSALNNWSKPGCMWLETGIVPVSSLSLKSNHESIDKLPIECGIDPLKLLEARDLHKGSKKKIRKLNENRVQENYSIKHVNHFKTQWKR